MSRIRRFLNAVTDLFGVRCFDAVRPKKVK
jgi:hypothetical protein